MAVTVQMGEIMRTCESPLVHCQIQLECLAVFRVNWDNCLENCDTRLELPEWHQKSCQLVRCEVACGGP